MVTIGEPPGSRLSGLNSAGLDSLKAPHGDIKLLVKQDASDLAVGSLKSILVFGDTRLELVSQAGILRGWWPEPGDRQKLAEERADTLVGVLLSLDQRRVLAHVGVP